MVTTFSPEALGILYHNSTVETQKRFLGRIDPERDYYTLLEIIKTASQMPPEQKDSDGISRISDLMLQSFPIDVHEADNKKILLSFASPEVKRKFKPLPPPVRSKPTISLHNPTLA